MMEQRSSRRESRGWFFFFVVQGSAMIFAWLRANGTAFRSTVLIQYGLIYDCKYCLTVEVQIKTQLDRMSSMHQLSHAVDYHITGKSPTYLHSSSPLHHREIPTQSCTAVAHHITGKSPHILLQQ